MTTDHPSPPRDTSTLAGGDAARRTRRRFTAPVVALIVAALLAGLVAVFARADSTNTTSAASPLMNRPAPALSGDLVDGGSFELARRKGSWVLLNFFDVTCVPCVEEHPELVAFADRQASQPGGAELYSVIWGSEPRASRQFLRDNGATWPIVRDDGSIAVSLAVIKVPETWIIDPNGYVRARLIGAVTADGLDEVLTRLRAAPPPTTAAES